MLVSKKSIFSDAWNRARNAAKFFGGKPSEYFRECLKDGWKVAKAIPNMKGAISETLYKNPLTGWLMSFEITSKLVKVNGKVKSINSAIVRTQNNRKEMEYLDRRTNLTNEELENFQSQVVKSQEQYNGALSVSYTTLLGLLTK